MSYLSPPSLAIFCQPLNFARFTRMIGLIAFVYVAYTAPVTAAGGYATDLVYAVFPDLPISQETTENLINGLAMNLLLA